MIDSGTYTYTGDRPWRRKSRSALSHNTLIIDGIETDERIASAQFGEVAGEKALQLVGLKRKLNSLVKFEKDGDKVVCTGEHVGYEILPDQVIVQRTLNYGGENQVEFTDVLKRKGVSPKDGEVTERFTLHSDCKVEIKDNVAIIENNGEKVELSTEKGYIKTEQGFHATNYGTRKDTTTLVIVLPRDVESNTFKIKW
jgi:hypothetical protein